MAAKVHGSLCENIQLASGSLRTREIIRKLGINSFEETLITDAWLIGYRPVPCAPGRVLYPGSN